jgi:hypothetical protein
LHRLDRTSFAWRTHSITSSTRISIDIGTSSPSALANAMDKRAAMASTIRMGASSQA